MSRSYTKEFDVEAPLEAVWRAIAEAEQLTRWFCTNARGTEGVGGTQWVDWGGGMCGEADIVIWEPNAHLRTETRVADNAARGLGDSDAPYATDWYLTHENGVTHVRMVASGFGEGPMWEGEYDGTFHGWDMFHANLKHYLERHPGKPAHHLVLCQAGAATKTEAWAQLFGPEGFVAEGATAGLARGSAYDFKSANGLSFNGTVHNWMPGKTFSGTVSNLDDAIIEVEFMGPDDGPMIWLSLYLYGQRPENVEAIKAQLAAIVTPVFPQVMGGS